MKPRWRWTGIGAAVLIAAFAVSAWIKQRAAHQPDAPMPGTGGVVSPAARKPAAVAAKPEEGVKPATSPHDRPERGRADRP